VPPSSDPRRLSQARQATEALYGRAPNPFAGWSRAELSAIVYDESGAYTINERYAAANQRTELDQKFWAPVFQRALDSGDWKPVITAALVFYASLSAWSRPPIRTTTPSCCSNTWISTSCSRKRRCRRNNRWTWRACWKRWCCRWDRWPGRRCHPGSDAAAPGAVIGRTDRRCTAPGRPDPGQQCAHSVQDSAYLVLLQRVFGVLRREDEPAPVRRATAGVASRDFLAYGDRRLLAEAYAYAQANGMALDEVDALARDLATYRRHAPAVRLPAAALPAGRRVRHAGAGRPYEQ
jgi:hypothetical protein